MWKRSILLWPKDKNVKVSHTLLRVKKTIERQNGKERPFFHTLSQREYSNIIICSPLETRIQQSNRRRNYKLLFLLLNAIAQSVVHLYFIFWWIGIHSLRKTKRYTNNRSLDRKRHREIVPTAQKGPKSYTPK